MKTITKQILLWLLCTSTLSQAAIINWGSGTIETNLPASIPAGAIVALYQDVNADNALGWQTTQNALLLNTDLSVAGGQLGMENDVFLGLTTTLTTLDSGSHIYKYLDSKANLSVANNIQIYTVILNSTSVNSGDLGLVIDTETFDTGSSSSAIDYYCDYDASTDSYGNVAGTLNAVSIVPEPATFGMMFAAGISILFFRKRFRR